MAVLLVLLLIAGGACLSYIEATAVKSPYLRGRDSYNRLPRTNNTFQNRETVVNKDRSRGGQWPEQMSSFLKTTATSSCDKGESFTVSSQRQRDLAGCYKKTGTYNGEALYIFQDQFVRRYKVAATNFNESNTSPDVQWTLARMDSVHHDIVCISMASAYHTHPVDASWTCDFLYRGPFPTIANPNDITFSCGCTTVMRDSRVKTKNYHRRKTNDGAGIRDVIVFVLLISPFFVMICHQIWSEQARSRIGSQCSSSAETAQNTQAAADTSSNEPGSEIEMLHLIRRTRGAANNLRDLLVEEEKLLRIPQ